jgi:hypothetical protein
VFKSTYTGHSVLVFKSTYTGHSVLVFKSTYTGHSVLVFKTSISSNVFYATSERPVLKKNYLNIAQKF